MSAASERERLRHLIDVVEAEAAALKRTDAELFVAPFDAPRASSLRQDNAIAEKVDAFAMRFGRLQDTLGDKLLPAVLRAGGEPPQPLIDNLRLAERFGWLDDADNWLLLRQLRNRLVHDYLRDDPLLAEALNAAHEGSASLLRGAARLLDEARRRLHDGRLAAP